MTVLLNGCWCATQQCRVSHKNQPRIGTSPGPEQGPSQNVTLTFEHQSPLSSGRRQQLRRVEGLKTVQTAFWFVRTVLLPLEPPVK